MNRERGSDGSCADQGFRAGYVGKWHLGNEVLPQRGLEEFWRSVDGKVQNMYSKKDYFESCRYDHVRTVRTSRHKLTLTPGDIGEFYDLERDPWEMENRFGDPAYAALIAELHRKLVRWQKRADDPLALTIPIPV